MPQLQVGPVPLYFQLQRHLREQIEAGAFKPGAALPTESALCGAFSVSRITVRHALDALAATGLIVRRRGVGTFVADAVGPAKSVTLVASLDEMLAPAKDLTRKLLGSEVVAASPLVARALGLAAGTRVVCLESLHISGAGPFSYARLYFPEDIGAGVLAAVPGDVPVMRTVERIVRRPIARAEQTVEPAVADRLVAQHLGMRPRAPVLQVMRTYFVDDTRPVQTVIAWYHPGRYRYTVQLYPRPVRPDARDARGGEARR